MDRKQEEGKQKSSSSNTGIVIAVIGIVLIIAGGAYALYERYVVGGTRLSVLAFNPIVDALAIIGLILLILGIAMYYRAKTPSMSTGTSATTGGGAATGSGRT